MEGKFLNSFYQRNKNKKFILKNIKIILKYIFEVYNKKQTEKCVNEEESLTSF